MQSYSQDTYAKRGNVKEFWKHFLGNKKENDPTHMQGGTQRIISFFSLSYHNIYVLVPIPWHTPYFKWISTILLLSQYLSFTCPFLYFMCGSQWEEVELVYYFSFTHNIYLFIYLWFIHHMNIEYWILNRNTYIHTPGNLGSFPSEPFCPSLLVPYTPLDSHGICGSVSTPS